MHLSVQDATADLSGHDRFRLPVEIDWTAPGPFILQLLPAAGSLPAFHLKAILSESAGPRTADPLELHIDGSRITGRASVALGAASPEFAAALEADSFSHEFGSCPG